MITWTGDELDRIAGAEELSVASQREDGSLGGWRTIWVVRDGDQLYVRSVYGTGSAWYRGTRVRGSGRIRAGGVEKDVTFTDAEPEVNDRLDEAYRAKYGRYAESILQAITSDEARWTTMRLDPRPKRHLRSS